MGLIHVRSASQELLSSLVSFVCDYSIVLCLMYLLHYCNYFSKTNLSFFYFVLYLIKTIRNIMCNFMTLVAPRFAIYMYN